MTTTEHYNHVIIVAHELLGTEAWFGRFQPYSYPDLKFCLHIMDQKKWRNGLCGEVVRIFNGYKTRMDSTTRLLFAGHAGPCFGEPDRLNNLMTVQTADLRKAIPDRFIPDRLIEVWAFKMEVDSSLIAEALSIFVNTLKANKDAELPAAMQKLIDAFSEIKYHAMPEDIALLRHEIMGHLSPCYLLLQLAGDNKDEKAKVMQKLTDAYSKINDVLSHYADRLHNPPWFEKLRQNIEKHIACLATSDTIKTANLTDPKTYLTWIEGFRNDLSSASPPSPV